MSCNGTMIGRKKDTKSASVRLTLTAVPISPPQGTSNLSGIETDGAPTPARISTALERQHGVPVCRQLPQQAQQQPLGNVEPTPRCYTRQHQKFESSGTSKSTNKSLQMLSTIIHPRLQCQSRPAPLVKSKRQTVVNRKGVADPMEPKAPTPFLP
ncbi:hypothetical protein V6N13_119546 [Hibiscus sabdariffa]